MHDNTVTYTWWHHAAIHNERLLLARYNARENTGNGHRETERFINAGALESCKHGSALCSNKSSTVRTYQVSYLLELEQRRHILRLAEHFIQGLYQCLLYFRHAQDMVQRHCKRQGGCVGASNKNVNRFSLLQIMRH